LVALGVFLASSILPHYTRHEVSYIKVNVTQTSRAKSTRFCLRESLVTTSFDKFVKCAGIVHAGARRFESRRTRSAAGINPTRARRCGHPMAGTPVTPAMWPSSMKASTVGENRRSRQAASTSRAEIPRSSAIGVMTAGFETSACLVKNADETS
jgi:hypothetical protein